MILQSDALPLDRFQPSERARIQALVDAASPPPRLLTIGSGAGRQIAQIESRAWYEWFWQRGMTPDREPIADSVRAAVFARDGKRCRYCADVAGPFALDHVHPRIQGGRDHAGNLVVSCRTCNSKKGGRTPSQAGMVLAPVPANGGA